MLAILMLIGGIVSMVFGALCLTGWVGGGGGSRSIVYDCPGRTKTDRQWLTLYFLATVVAPLLGGAMLILFGLQRL